jgi:hypothetical protein
VSFKTGCDTYPKRTLCAESGYGGTIFASIWSHRLTPPSVDRTRLERRKALPIWRAQCQRALSMKSAIAKLAVFIDADSRFDLR